ncbi:MAG: methyltransferase domain-containing protein [Candidatus Eisenbacteria bacterium]|nr:methyltransferase domain-containing protein [Candidatus Eisenbacteria bacterium]
MEPVYRTGIVQRLLERRRRRRAEFFISKVRMGPETKILDVGCGPNGRSLEDFLPSDYTIVGIDILPPDDVATDHPGFTYIEQDASDLSRFSDGQFDVAFSIGMMEHICDRPILRRMLSEIDRVARQYVIMVPWKWAWIEPHFKLPFFQLLPRGLQNALTRALNLHELRDAVRRNPRHIEEHYQWLASREWKEMLPEAEVHLCPSLETIAIVKSAD